MRWPFELHPLRGVRARTALAAILVVAVALAAAATSLVLLQRRELVQGLTTVAQEQGSQVAAQITAGGVESVDIAVVSASAGERALVQVVTPAGQVTAASAAVEGERPASTATPGPGEVVVQTMDRLPIGEDEPFVVVTTGVQTPQGVARVITAQSLATVDRSIGVTLTLLGIGYPLMLIFVAGTSYWLAGRALAPVEAIRQRVSEVSAVDLGARVPVPSSGDEISRLALTMNQMLARLQQAADSQRQFVADASHELRSPLATIRATAELAGTHPDVLTWPEGSQTILDEADRLERVVSDLLLLARAEEHGLVMRTEDVDLDDVVTAEAARLRQLNQHHLVLDVRSVRVRGDAQDLVRAVRNLTDNAARHARSSVTLRLHSVDRTAVLEVLDDGPGIPAGERQRVFERFVRLDASRERAKGGSGLGLAIARQIARAHGGDVQVADSEPPGGGAHLVLTVPLPAHDEPPITDGAYGSATSPR
ncbi:MAG: sensor histidine kinase [Cellulomonas sp.]